MPTYPWTRFWAPRTGTLNLSDGGFLVDPETEWGRFANPDLVTFSSTIDDRCLIFLGEPGIGKTAAIQLAYHELRESSVAGGDDAVLIDLKPYGSEDRLSKDIFQSDPWRRWLSGSHFLYLFLDSLDECRLRISNVTALLTKVLEESPFDRLRLRIACRTAEWPAAFEDHLTRLFGENHFRALELAPLRRVDVIAALQANSIDVDRFISELRRLGAVPFAIKPITLNFLLNVFRRGGQLPATSKELYLEGCRLLCEEVDADRRGAPGSTRLSAEQLLLVASRIAAVTMFTNRSAVWTSIDAGDVPGDDVTMNSLAGGHEGTGGQLVEVNESTIREALATGLFSSRGPTRLGWSHATYAEFLAAHYVMRKGLALQQLLSLTVHPADPDGKLVPQLHEVAAWLAGMSHSFFQEIMLREPELLLRSDVASADVNERSKLVDAVLRLADQGLFVDRDWGLRTRYSKLAHPQLAEQLRPYIADPVRHLVARRVATDIAEACQLKDLQHALVDIALDEREAYAVRENTAVAVKRIADASVKLRLKPLIARTASDRDNQLRGIALSALWPEQLSAEELFSVLVPSGSEDTIGTYRYFAANEVAARLTPADLPIALNWVSNQPGRHTMEFGLDELVTKILTHAWNHLDSADVLEAFAKAALSRLRHHEALFQERSQTKTAASNLLNDTERRHRVVDAIVCLLARAPLSREPSRDGFYVASPRSGLIFSEDFAWLEERVRSTTRPEKELWTQVLRYTVTWDNPRVVRRVIRLRLTSARLRQAFPLWPLLLAAYIPPGFRLFRWWRERSWRRGFPKPKPLRPHPDIRIARLLQRCESGESAAWWRITREMTLEPTDTHYSALESDLTALPGWKAASAETRRRLLRAAEQYVIENNADSTQWLGQKILYWPAIAGYGALRLLHQEAPDQLQRLPPAVWAQWAPIVLGYPGSATPADTELVELTLRHAPDAFTTALTALVTVQSDEGGYLQVLERIGDAWSPAIAAALSAALQRPGLDVLALGHLLDVLLIHDVPEARGYAASLIAQPLGAGTAASDQSVRAAVALLSHARDGGWDILWPKLQDDAGFGDAVIMAIVDSPSADDIVSRRLSEDQLSQLYVWLARRFPPSEDPDIRGMHTVSTREQIGHWRDSILAQLRSRGTSAAYNALLAIQRELPELRWLSWTILEARDALRRREWSPPRPEHVIRLAEERTRRLVQNGESLVGVLGDSLTRLQQELHGETPTVQFLWNTWAEGGSVRHRPKEENALSDFTKSHLERDLKGRGVIVNREVEIRRGIGTAPGERTDIHVDAVARDDGSNVYDRISAIIEVKGNWHPELRTAMETQLRDRYLHENRCHYGLYLVGWFNCAAWDANDSRKARAHSWTFTEAHDHLEAQAQSLSTAGLHLRSFLLDATLP